MLFSFANLFTTLTVYAGEAGGDPAQSPGGGIMSMLVTFLPLILIMYFMFIMPQRKRDKQTKAMIAALKMGDEIVTIGGINGKIVRIKDDTVVLESGAGMQKSFIRVDRSAISRMVKEGSGKDKEVTPIPGYDDFDDDNGGDSEE